MGPAGPALRGWLLGLCVISGVARAAFPAPRGCWLSPGATSPQLHAWPRPLVQRPLPSTSFRVLLLSGGELLGPSTSLPLSVYLWSSTQPGSWLSGILDCGALGARWPGVEWTGRGPRKQKDDAGSALSDLCSPAVGLARSSWTVALAGRLPSFVRHECDLLINPDIITCLFLTDASCPVNVSKCSVERPEVPGAFSSPGDSDWGKV